MNKVLFKGEYMSMQTAEELAILNKENKELKAQIEHLENLCNEHFNSFEKLFKRVNKAIEYIEEHSLNFNGECEIDLEVEEVKDLYKILKGEENNKGKLN